MAHNSLAGIRKNQSPTLKNQDTMLKMSGNYQIPLLILSILIPLSLFRSSEACGIAMYSGQGIKGVLSDACATGKYKYVNLAFLNTFGSGQAPVLHLYRSNCSTLLCNCVFLKEEIESCQSHGVKVLLSLGGSIGSYNISSPENAREVANYLWNTYLGGDAPSIGFCKPLGNVVLDGVDFNIEKPGSTLYWDELARALSEFSTPERKIYLSAAPQCVLPDPNLDTAIRTGLFDYVWVKFYNNDECEYRGDVPRLLDSWKSWSSYLLTQRAASELFLGVPTSPADRIPGYIPPDVLVNQILPVIRTSVNYGGVMLWNWNFGMEDYSSDIYPAVCGTTLNPKELLISQVV